MAAVTVMEMVKEKIKDKRYTPLMKKAVRLSGSFFIVQ